MRKKHQDQARPFCRNTVMISAKWPGVMMMLLAHAWQPTKQFLHPFEIEEAAIGCTCLATGMEVIEAATQTIRQFCQA